MIGTLNKSSTLTGRYLTENIGNFLKNGWKDRYNLKNHQNSKKFERLIFPYHLLLWWQPIHGISTKYHRYFAIFSFVVVSRRWPFFILAKLHFIVGCWHMITHELFPHVENMEQWLDWNNLRHCWTETFW